MATNKWLGSVLDNISDFWTVMKQKLSTNAANVPTPYLFHILLEQKLTELEESIDTGYGDVEGPEGAMDNAIVIFNGITGKLVKNSGVKLDDLATATQGKLAETAVQPDSTNTLTNKTIIDYTNHIHADAVHHRIKCVDPTGVTPGTAVAFAGWNSGEEAIEVVRANNTTSIAIGIVLETLANGEFGLMIMSGTVTGIDTTTFPKGAGVAQQGDILYVNGNGQLTGDEPTTGFAQPIALLLRFQSNTGALQVLAAYPKQDASDVRFTPTGSITATDVQAAIAALEAAAVKKADESTASMQFVIDEDNMTSNLDTKVPTQQSVKAYVDNAIVSAKSYQGGYNAETNTPDLDVSPTGISKGDIYDVTAAGLFFTESVEVGDTLTAKQDNPTLLSHWVITQTNLTPQSIKTQYESNTNTNAFTDAEKSKLSGIEAGATADQTASEIKSAYESNADTNAFTDAYKNTVDQAILDADFTTDGLMKRTGAGTYDTAVPEDDYVSPDIPIVTVPTSKTLALTDRSKYLRCTDALDMTLTVPDEATVNFPIGTTITIRQAAAGSVALVASVGVTINGGLNTAGQHTDIQIIKVASNVWDVIGGS